MAAQHQLTVAILTDEDRDWQRTAVSLSESGRRARTPVEVYLAWSASARPPAESFSLPIRAMFRLGRAYVKNRVLGEGEAPLVGFVDAGAEVGPDWVGAVVRAFSETPRLAMTFAPASGAAYDRAYPRTPERRPALRQLLASLQTAHVTNLVLRRDAAVTAGGFDLRLDAAGSTETYEDLDLALRLIKSGTTIACCAAMSSPQVPTRREPPTPAVTARQVGAIARRNRSLRLCALYARSLPGTTVPEALTALGALAGGLVVRRSDLSPQGVLDAMPKAVRTFVGDMPIAPLRASHPPKTHFMYAAGDALLLHLYANPSAQLRRSLEEREEIRARVPVGGIPTLHLAIEDVDALWVVEDRLRGAHPAPEAVSAWFDHVGEWAVHFAGDPGPSLRTSPEWRDHRAAVLAVCPPSVYAPMAEAVRKLDGVPSAHMHGDFQRRNLLLTASQVGLVDWEGAWLRGIPGLDLVFLALLARGDSPEASVIHALLAGTDPPFGSLLQHLSRVGVKGGILRPALLVMLGSWLLGEERRVRRTRGVESSSRPYRDLLLNLASSFAA